MIQLIEILIDCLYFHSKNGNDPARDSFDKYYMPIVEVKDYYSNQQKSIFWSASKKQTTSV